MNFISCVFFLATCLVAEQIIDGGKLREVSAGIYCNEKIPYTGKAVYCTENGEKYEEGFFKDGKKDGRWSFFYKNAQIANEGSYEQGKKDGIWQYYSRNGEKVLSIKFIDGTKWREFGLRPDGKEFEGSFENELPLNGVIMEKYPWGLIDCIDTRGNSDEYKYVSYRHGVKNGVTTWFVPDKKIIAEGRYLNDERWEGTFVIQRSQFLWEIVSCREGIPDGEIRYFTLEDVNWRSGELFKHKMIELKPCGIYKEGQRWQGLFIKPSPGKEYLWERMFYENGKLVRKEYTALYSGYDDESAQRMKLLPVKEESAQRMKLLPVKEESAQRMKLLPVKEEKSPDSKSGDKSDDSVSGSKVKTAAEQARRPVQK